jgi:two-component system, LytTR family, sensor kinase
MLLSRKSPLVFHIFGWLVFLSLPLLFLYRGKDSLLLYTSLHSVEFWFFFLIFLALFYANYSLLIPRYFFAGRYLIYGALSALALLLILWVKPFDRLANRRELATRQGTPPPDFRAGHPPEFGDPSAGMRPGKLDFPDRRFPDRRPPNLDIVSIVLLLMIWALGLAIRITQRWHRTERLMIQAQADKTQAELSSLKAQINPHFLFNTLNTIYTLARLHHPACADSIMKLSNIMRYVSDEVAEDLVPLEDEVACIRQYIELQQLRLNKKTAVHFEVRGEVPMYSIPPLVLMTLVENIFKHGVSNHEASVIEIKIEAMADSLSFYSKNRDFSQRSETERAGIGLANVRKRLAHLYPERHELHSDSDGEYFVVKLMIKA